MKINSNSIINFLGATSVASSVIMIGSAVVEKIKSRNESQDADGTIEFSQEDITKLQDEMDDLREEIEMLKAQQEPTEAATTEEEISETTTEEVTPETTEPTKDSEITTSSSPSSSIEDNTTTQYGVRSDITLKELNLEMLSQSEANEIWKSYLHGTCEYDLNDNNLAEFCQKFGFNINLVT